MSRDDAAKGLPSKLYIRAAEWYRRTMAPPSLFLALARQKKNLVERCINAADIYTSAHLA